MLHRAYAQFNELPLSSMFNGLVLSSKYYIEPFITRYDISIKSSDFRGSKHLEP